MARRSCGLGLACFALLAAAAGVEPFNTWAEKTSFQIGDTLRECQP